MELDIAMKQTQKLALTPQMEQSLSMLQMSAQELEQYIADEILSNPMLTCEEPEQGTEKKEYPEEEMSEYSGIRKISGERGDYQSYINSLVDEKSCGTSLKDSLRMQLCVGNVSKMRQKIAKYLIECMEESGYLKMTNLEISKALGLTTEEVEEEIRFLQGLEPCGVFARDLRECLLLQIKQKGEDEELYQLVEHYIEEIIHNKIPKICKSTGWSRTKVLALISKVKELDPVPGRGYGTGIQGEFIYPDITVRRVDGRYHAFLNRGRAPIPKINQEYLPLLTQEKAGHDYEYMQEQYRNAKMLLKNIGRREETLRSVACAIVKRQQEFFEKGKMYLSPMKLADIATDVDLHESTVSRALKEKYLECRWGIFELKYFFSNKGARKNGSRYFPANCGEISGAASYTQCPSEEGIPLIIICYK